LYRLEAGRQKARFFPPALSLKAHFSDYPTDFTGIGMTAEQQAKLF
jgi:hypothetical protein